MYEPLRDEVNEVLINLTLINILLPYFITKKTTIINAIRGHQVKAHQVTRSFVLN